VAESHLASESHPPEPCEARQVKYANGWTGYNGAHGANLSDGRLHHTGTGNLSVSGGNINFNHKLTMGSICTNTTFAGSIPTAIPAQGTIAFSHGTITMDAVNNTATAYTTVQGRSVSMTVSQIDMAAKTFNLTYADLLSGETHTVTLNLPYDLYSAASNAIRTNIHFSKWQCVAIETAGIIVAAAAVLAAVLAVPVSLSLVLIDGFAYLGSMGLATAGMGAFSVACAVVHSAGC